MSISRAFRFMSISRLSTATVIDGKAVAKTIRAQLKSDVLKIKEKNPHFNPRLAILLVGSNKDSVSYVKAKDKAAQEVGISVALEKFPETAKESTLLEKIRQLNEDKSIHGVLIQMPLPPYVNKETVLEAVDFQKDVDGFHPYNIGKMIQKASSPLFLPCTPKGILNLIQSTGRKISGQRAVVVGRGDLVGAPVASLLTSEDATVTLCHSRTLDLKNIVKQADILVCAVGQPELIKGDWIKPGAIVIDVGMTSINDNSKKSGTRWVGDVEFNEAKKAASFITPVPGGVGPMTVAMLLENTILSSKRLFGLDK
ncbi:putative 5,10-methylenetetrahydrofolate dehydrogenase:5,10-methenyltetrahydrofolate cyclohydrolase [Sporodiniella umbellata]|nr:putative 5,10-methylenetetrahydrofolate dehydrogenase:5,10-methenyltetrahydrofolate cyclohydrolase [Sporodiniella umbellata]